MISILSQQCILPATAASPAELVIIYVSHLIELTAQCISDESAAFSSNNRISSHQETVKSTCIMRTVLVQSARDIADRCIANDSVFILTGRYLASALCQSSYCKQVLWLTI